MWIFLHCHFNAFYRWLCGMGFAHCWKPYDDIKWLIYLQFNLSWRLISLAIIQHFLFYIELLKPRFRGVRVTQPLYVLFCELVCHFVIFNLTPRKLKKESPLSIINWKSQKLNTNGRQLLYCGAGSVYPSGAPRITPIFWWDWCCLVLFFYVVSCVILFIRLSFFLF